MPRGKYHPALEPRPRPPRQDKRRQQPPPQPATKATNKPPKPAKPPLTLVRHYAPDAAREERAVRIILGWPADGLPLPAALGPDNMEQGYGPDVSGS